MAAEVISHYFQQAVAPYHAHHDNHHSDTHNGRLQYGKLLCAGELPQEGVGREIVLVNGISAPLGLKCHSPSDVNTVI